VEGRHAALGAKSTRLVRCLVNTNANLGTAASSLKLRQGEWLCDGCAVARAETWLLTSSLKVDTCTHHQAGNMHWHMRFKIKVSDCSHPFVTA